MKRFVAFIAILALAAPAFAQADGTEDGLEEFKIGFALLMRVAEVPCSEELLLLDAQCYRHGYEDFFDFKEAFFGFAPDPLMPTQNWHVVEVGGEGKQNEAYRASFETRDAQTLTLTYFEGSLLVLQEGQATP